MSKRIILLALGLFLWVGCDQAPPVDTSETGITQASVASDTESVAPAPAVVQAVSSVSADAVLEPRRWSELSFDTAGQVTEVLVAPGDTVQAGAPLVRLDTLNQEINLLIAEQEVLAQEAAIRKTVIDTANQIAQAELDLKIVQLSLEQVQLQGSDSSVSAAETNVEQLNLRLEQLRAQDPTPDVVAAQIDVTRAQNNYNFWLDEYNKSLDREWEPQEERDRYYSTLQQAEFDLELAQAQLDGTTNAQVAHAIDLQILQVQIAQAKTDLAQILKSRPTYTITLDIQAAQVAASQLELDNLLAQRNQLENLGPEQDLTEAEARLEQAKLVVEQLKLQMQKAELRAPFAGTVVDVRANVDDQVNMDQVVIVVATLDQLQARTTNLSEIDVAQVKVGQSATLTLDALPDREITGIVRHIELRPEMVDDKVTYPVYVSLTDADIAPALRWGMNALIEIEIE